MTTEDLMKLADAYARMNAQTTAPGAGDARQALLDALEALGREVARLTESVRYEADCVAAIEAERDTFRAELAAIRATQEPVGWFTDVTVHGKSVGDFQLAAREHWGDYSVCVPLYASPAAKDAGLVADDRITECAKRLVEHADFQLGGILSADSKAKDIPSKAVSQVKSRHLAALRDALAASPKLGGV